MRARVTGILQKQADGKGLEYPEKVCTGVYFGSALKIPVLPLRPEKQQHCKYKGAQRSARAMRFLWQDVSAHREPAKK